MLDVEVYQELTQEERDILEEGHKKTVGQVIREAREQKGYGQRELARLVDISGPQLNRIEGDVNRPSRESLKKISAYLGIEYGELTRIAGFSSLKGDRRLFDKSGEEINTDGIIRDIYRVDSSLLGDFEGFGTFATDKCVRALRVLLRNAKKIYGKEGGCTNSGEDDIFFSKSFEKLLDFILALYE